MQLEFNFNTEWWNSIQVPIRGFENPVKSKTKNEAIINFKSEIKQSKSAIKRLEETHHKLMKGLESNKDELARLRLGLMKEKEILTKLYKE